MKRLLTIAAALMPLLAIPQSYIGMFDHNDLDHRSERELQYTPTSDGYIRSHNGKILYTRALYGGNTAFRIETGDRPIFAAFHGKDNRNVHFVIDIDGRSQRLDSVAECESFFRGGERRYVLSDPSWGKGKLIMTVLAPRDYEGGIWKIEATGMPKSSVLKAYTCATKNVKINRNGDMGADPANCFAPDPDKRDLRECSVRIGGKNTTVFVGYEDRNITSADQKALAARFATADAQREELSGRLKIDTPDPYFNGLGAIIVNAADGNWDGKV